MPKTKIGESVLDSMTKQYGSKKGKKVFYASINKKKKGMDKMHMMKQMKKKQMNVVDSVMEMRKGR